MIYLFNRYEELIHIVRKQAIKTAYQTEKLTNEGYVSDQLETESQAIDESIMSQVEYVAMPHEKDTDKYHFYWLKSYHTQDNTTTITAVPSGIEDLSKHAVKDMRPNKATLREVVKRLLENTRWEMGYSPDDTGQKNTTFYYISVWDALKKTAQLFNVEMRLFVEVTNNRIGSRYIDFKKQVGGNFGKRVVYGHNALKIVREVERSEIYTALIGRGRGEQVSEAGDVGVDGETTTQDGYGRKINFADIVWSKSAGNPADKPEGQEYVEDPIATERYGIYDPFTQRMMPKIGFIDFPEEEDKKALLEQTWLALERYKRPRVEMKTSSTYLDGNIGDTIRVVREDKEWDFETRIFEITKDRVTDFAIDIKLGDKLIMSQAERDALTQRRLDSSTKGMIDSAAQRIEEVTYERLSANGYNRNYYGKVDPVELGATPRKGDTWFRDHPEHEGHTIIYVWNGDGWEEILDTYSFGAEVEAKIDEAQQKADEMAKEISEIQTRTEKELAEFEKQLKDFDTSIGNLNFEKIQEEVDRLIAEGVTPDKIDEAIKNSGFGKSLDDIERRLADVSDTAELTSRIIGNDGKPIYSRNRVDGTTDRVREFKAPPITINHNGEGFKAGETYTISFEALCEWMEKIGITLDFVYPSNISREVEVSLVPTEELIPSIVEKTKGAYSTSLYPFDYGFKASNPWYQTINDVVTPTTQKQYTIHLNFRNRIVGDTKSERIFKWSDPPELILKGEI